MCKSVVAKLEPGDLDVDLVEDNIEDILNEEKEKEVNDEENYAAQTELEELVDTNERRSDYDFIIGEPKANFNLNESLFYSCNYFRRGTKAEVAECLMCEQSQIKTSLKTTDANTKGSK